MLNIVGLTGGIACGKSTVATLMHKHGVPIVDADQLAREIVAPGQPALAQIVDLFGKRILNADGELDRTAVGQIVFGDSNARQQLERITHPAIALLSQKRFASIADEGYALALYEAALLVETGGYKGMAALIVVSAPPELQVKRLLARNPNLTAKDAKQRIESQMPVKEKENFADFVIHNDGTLEELATDVERVLGELRRSIDG